MDDLLPSYESVIKQSPWELIAPYLPSEDLCSAALVCQKWHEAFTPRLWGNPASHFGLQNDTVYVALTRFKRTLPWVRLAVRELTHTLHLPPAHAELYGGPHSEWLRDCLERLPRLQCLIVNGLPFFDHASLLTLRHSSPWWRSTHPDLFPVYGLRLLDASRCSNATSTGLAEALPHFPDLVSLDLSGTSAARDNTVLQKMKFLRNLRVLKLKGLGLKDSDFQTVASSIGVRVRSLDVSENQLTDASARLLLEYCIKDTTYEHHSTRAPLQPVADARPLNEMEIFGTENLDSHLRKKLTQGFIGSLAIEDARDMGITHLYVSKNMITVEGTSGLLRSKRLQVLDAGTLPVALQRPCQSSSEEDDDELALPGVEKLTPILAEYASEKLKYLRINFAVLTDDAPIESLPSPRAELPGSDAIYAPADAHELPAFEPPQPELDSTTTAVYELPGDFVPPVELPGSSHAAKISSPSQGPKIEVTSEPIEIKRGAAYAPEPVFIEPAPTEPLLSPVSPIVDASGGFAPFSPTSDASGGLSPSSTPFEDTISPPSPISSDGCPNGQINSRSRHNSGVYIEDRRARLDLRQSQENRLHPGMLPNVHTLVLTDVPTRAEDKEIVDRIVQFVQDCAEEAAIAKIRARHTYVLPPGRSRTVAEREYARSLFALRRIIFEMAPPQAPPKKVSTSWRQYPTKSSTEDTDSETFWEAAAHDFSFFGDEECGLPNAEPGRHLPPTAMSGLMLAPSRPALPPRPFQTEPMTKPVFDVVAEIAKFRKDRKAVYHNLLQLGELDPIVEGHWPGDITVVRQPVNRDAGSLDYYGNRYESGWYYR